jgi:hypothetical protein
MKVELPAIEEPQGIVSGATIQFVTGPQLKLVDYDYVRKICSDNLIADLGESLRPVVVRVLQVKINSRSDCKIERCRIRTGERAEKALGLIGSRIIEGKGNRVGAEIIDVADVDITDDDSGAEGQSV